MATFSQRTECIRISTMTLSLLLLLLTLSTQRVQCFAPTPAFRQGSPAVPTATAIRKHERYTYPAPIRAVDAMTTARSASTALPAFRSTSNSVASTSQPHVVNHRHSAGDWLYNVFSLPKSSVLREIRSPVITIAAWSGAVSVFQRVLAGRATSSLCQTLAKNMCIGATPHSFLVSSLGLLLVFRTNSAYQRFNVSEKIQTSTGIQIRESLHSEIRHGLPFVCAVLLSSEGHCRRHSLSVSLALCGGFSLSLSLHLQPPLTNNIASTLTATMITNES